WRKNDERDVPQRRHDNGLTRNAPLDARVFEEIVACVRQRSCAGEERANAAANSLPEFAPGHGELWSTGWVGCVRCQQSAWQQRTCVNRLSLLGVAGNWGCWRG